MDNADFHGKPFDAGTLAKLRIFELYTQEWIPVFVSQQKPRFGEIHLFDFFCGPGTDSEGTLGSPLRILRQLRGCHGSGMAGWKSVRIFAHLFDEDAKKVARLKSVLTSDLWNISGAADAFLRGHRLDPVSILENALK